MGQKILGQVIEIHYEPIIKTIKGKKIKRNGSQSNPAYLVQSEAGNYALKLHGELSPNTLDLSTSKIRNKPQIFSD